MDWPGAMMSTHEPQLLKPERWSDDDDAPTVMALGACAGLASQASASSLPAATTVTTPASSALSIAMMGAWYVYPSKAPSDADTTHGPPVHDDAEHLEATLSMASIR